MSAFSDWNGPGDIPGDLSIFYQRLLELERIIVKFFGTSEPNKPYLQFQREIEEKIEEDTDALEEVRQGYEDAKQAMQDLMQSVQALANKNIDNYNFNDITAKALFIKNVIDMDSNATAQWIISYKNWFHNAKQFYANRLGVYDHIAFKSYKIDRTGHNGDAIPGEGSGQTTGDGTITKSLMSSSVAKLSGEYIIGVIDEGDEVPNGDYAAGTIFFTVKDSLQLAAVVNVAMALQNQPSGTNIYHGALNVTYAYNASGDESSGTLLEFFIRPGSGTSGDRHWYVTCKAPSGGEGHAWSVGRNIRRWIDGVDNTPSTTIIAYARSEHGTGEGGACHGVMISDLTTQDLNCNDLQVEDESHLEGPVHAYQNMQVDGNLNVNGRITGASLAFGGNLDVNGNLHVTGSSQLDGPVISGPQTVNGAITAAGDITGAKGTFSGDVSTANLNVTGNERVTGNLTVDGQLSAPNTDNFRIKNLTVDQNATIGGNANITGDLGARHAAFADVKSNKLINSAGDTYVEFNGGTNVGLANSPTNFKSSQRPHITQGTVDHEFAYLDDLVSGTLFQKGVTAYSTGAIPNGPIPLENGLTYGWEVGDTLLVKGTLSGTTAGANSTVKIYTVTAVSATNVPTWDNGVFVPNPPKNGNNWVSFMWIGLAIQHDNLYDNSYIFWNPNNAAPDDWTIADLHMESYRLASAQDQLDATLGALIGINPDWRAEDPMVAVPTPVPPRMPSSIPNPAFISNKPWMGFTKFNGGDWDNDGNANADMYNFVMEGGDFDQLYKNLNQGLPMDGSFINFTIGAQTTGCKFVVSMMDQNNSQLTLKGVPQGAYAADIVDYVDHPLKLSTAPDPLHKLVGTWVDDTGLTVFKINADYTGQFKGTACTYAFGGAFDQSIKNGVTQLMHGTESNLPPASPNTQFVLKFCTDSNKLYIDTGTANLLVATAS